MRTCLGCGKKAEKGGLFRIALRDSGEPFVDFPQHAPGRGAYVCGPGCWTGAPEHAKAGEKVKMAKSVGRAFRGRWKGQEGGVTAALVQAQTDLK